MQEYKNGMEKIMLEVRLLAAKTWHTSVFCGSDLRCVMYV